MHKHHRAYPHRAHAWAKVMLKLKLLCKLRNYCWFHGDSPAPRCPSLPHSCSYTNQTRRRGAIASSHVAVLLCTSLKFLPGAGPHSQHLHHDDYSASHRNSHERTPSVHAGGQYPRERQRVQRSRLPASRRAPRWQIAAAAAAMDPWYGLRLLR
jgi:hypothetical protein